MASRVMDTDARSPSHLRVVIADDDHDRGEKTFVVVRARGVRKIAYPDAHRAGDDRLSARHVYVAVHVVPVGGVHARRSGGSCPSASSLLRQAQAARDQAFR